MPEKEKKDKQDRMIEILEETLKWIRVTSIPNVKKLLLDILPNDKERMAYHFSDGKHNGQEVATFAGVATGTISNWWKLWVRSGIAESVSVKGGERARRLFSLEDFGIGVPPALETKQEKEQVEVAEGEVSTKEAHEATKEAEGMKEEQQ
jgi:hypothetical protein